MIFLFADCKKKIKKAGFFLCVASWLGLVAVPSIECGNSDVAGLRRREGAIRPRAAR
jgi:hypothetical protein